jgi:hypothetical protein
VDWTRSRYVAAYFALDGDFQATPEVWLINVLILQNDVYELDESCSPHWPMADEQVVQTFSVLILWRLTGVPCTRSYPFEKTRD